MLNYDVYKTYNAFLSDKASGKDISRFYTKSGWLSKYAIACGYIENIRIVTNVPTIQGNKTQDVRVTLEGYSARYHVKATSADFRHWESYKTLPEARKAFKALIKQLKA